MKTLIVIVGFFTLIVNVLTGFILPSYSQFNMLLNAVIIVIHTLLLLAVLIVNLKDAFRISLSCLFSTICVGMLVSGFYAVPQFENNVHLVAMVAVLLFELVVLMSTNYVTNKIK